MMNKDSIIFKIKISETVPEKFRKEVAPILSNEEFINLGRYDHHKSNRLIHSINVSYLSWRIAKKLRCDETVAARAGLLHDFCPYDFSEKTPTGEHQAFYHPKAAIKNSTRNFPINDK